MEDVITRDDIMKLLNKQRELNFPPGDAHLYCNAGYTLLGEIVAGISGYFAIAVLIRVLTTWGLRPFALYCFIAGSFAMVAL